MLHWEKKCRNFFFQCVTLFFPINNKNICTQICYQISVLSVLKKQTKHHNKLGEQQMLKGIMCGTDIAEIEKTLRDSGGLGRTKDSGTPVVNPLSTNKGLQQPYTLQLGIGLYRCGGEGLHSKGSFTLAEFNIHLSATQGIFEVWQMPCVFDFLFVLKGSSSTPTHQIPSLLVSLFGKSPAY